MAAAAVACAAALSACQVQTDVAVTEDPGGGGSVSVTVTLDAAADAAVGGLAQQLRTDGLAAAGWNVGAPRTLGGGSETVTATHAFATQAQAASVLASVAGTGSTHPFALSVVTSHTFWHTTTTLRGHVDLTCGVACFGDPGLTAQTGSPVGVDVAGLSRQSGLSAGQVLRFAMQVTLPGTVVSTDATSRPAPHELAWQPVLGRSVVLDATTTTTDSGHVAAAVAGAAAVLVVAVVALLLLWRRRRRRRPRRPGAHSRGSAGSVPESVAGPL